MKNQKMLLSMNLMDEKYIEEADSKNVKKKFNWRKFSVIAASIAVVLTALNLWLFIPYEVGGPPDVSQYADSEYYPLIQKLNHYYHPELPVKTNNFEKLQAMLSKVAKDNTGLDYSEGALNYTVYGAPVETFPAGSARPLSPDSESDPQYEEVTDNQVEGVIEADLMKRSDKYIYYLYNEYLLVYSIDGAQSKLVGTYTCKPDNQSVSWSGYGSQLYLSEDCRTLTVIMSSLEYDPTNVGCTLFSLDVSDPANIREKKQVFINFNYETSRLVNGEILLMGQYRIGANPDYGNAATFVPSILSDEKLQCIPMDGIISPDELTSTQYSVICKLDENTLAVNGSAAFLSYSQEVYVSGENIFATRRYTDTTTQEDIYTQTTMTEIAALSYTGDSIRPIGSISVAGSVKDQYSMDEYNGVLRVVTSTNHFKRREVTDGMTTSVSMMESINSASLYCIDLTTWAVVAAVENFSPEGETVESVRFDGDAAYVCTARVVVLTDPVFFFDLSDPSNITYKDTGTIDGYSTSLISFGDGYLVGIGVGDTQNTVKLEVYAETEDGVKSVCSYVIENARYSTDYKSYLIDRENQLIGLDVMHFNSGLEYHLLQYENGQLTLLEAVESTGTTGQTRAFCKDGYLYICSDAMFECRPITLREGE